MLVLAFVGAFAIVSESATATYRGRPREEPRRAEREREKERERERERERGCYGAYSVLKGMVWPLHS